MSSADAVVDGSDVWVPVRLVLLIEFCGAPEIVGVALASVVVSTDRVVLGAENVVLGGVLCSTGANVSDAVREEYTVVDNSVVVAYSLFVCEPMTMVVKDCPLVTSSPWLPLRLALRWTQEKDSYWWCSR